MEDKKSETLYRKAIKDFPDREIEKPKKYTPANKNTLVGLDIVSKNPILPFEKFTDVVGRSATEPDTVFVAPQETEGKLYTPAEKNTYTRPTVASALRNAMGIKVGEEIKARDIDPYTGIPLKTGFLSSLPSVTEATSPTLSGDYNPITGNIRMKTGLSPEDYLGTYAHEAGHKIKTQGMGLEGRKAKSIEEMILGIDFMDKDVYEKLLINKLKNEGTDIPKEYGKYVELFGKPVNKPMDVAKLVDTYYSGHHRADEPRAWETQALENLKTKGIIEEPFTPEARPENIPNETYRNRYYKLLNKRVK